VVLSSAYDNMATLDVICEAFGHKPFGKRFLSWFERALAL
jgi:hypothetical protein